MRLRLLKPVARTRLYQDITEQLMDLILKGEFEAGDKLPAERTLAKELAVSRISVREALKQLTFLGMVEIRQGDGVYVQDYKQNAGLEFWLTQLESGRMLDPKLVSDILELRRIFGRELLLLATERAGPEDIKSLQKIIDELTEAFEDPDPLKIRELFFEFEIELTRASGNQAFTMFLNTFRPLVALRGASAFNLERAKRNFELQKRTLELLQEPPSESKNKGVDELLANGEDLVKESLVDRS